MATVPMRPAAVPDTTEMLGGLPAYAATVAGLRNSLVQQLGSRGLRHTRWTLSPTGATPATAGPHVVSTTHRILHRVGPLASWAWLGYHYSATLAGTTGASVSVSLYSLTAVLIDGPVTWSEANGLLTTTAATGAGRYLSPRCVGRDSFASTGWETGTATPLPRLLDVSGYRGLDIEVRVTVVDARVWDMCIADAWFGDL